MNPRERTPLKLLIRGSSDGRSRSVIFELPRPGSSQDNGPALLPVLRLPTNPNDCHRQVRPDLACKEHSVPLLGVAAVGLLVKVGMVACWTQTAMRPISAASEPDSACPRQACRFKGAPCLVA
jgi:hypothetical protein